ncbi:MAG: AF1514 family protein [Desulfatiglans sp.]|jgi:hypothetical protein|nr:AF1514 family protein [Thermodesulfobacteriota bacterium]MEE4353695.1 AF1514 family protein [Desulfatiglans sp.]
MSECRKVTREVLTDPIDLKIKRDNLDFPTAKMIADQRAAEIAGEPMLLGWYNSHTSRFSPDVVCCSEEKPGWIVYAESRGGNITIDINAEEYVFIYSDLLEDCPSS